MEGERMRMEEKLHKAAVKGDLALLDEILGGDSDILIEIKLGSLTHTPLHVAASRGHSGIVERILQQNEALAGVVDPRRWSPLHLACAHGHHQVVRLLIGFNPEMCMALDGDGRNPLHLAAVKGHLEVFRVLFEDKPFAHHELLSAKDVGGNTILHLAVKHKRYQVIRYLLEIVEKGSKNEHTVKAVNALNACGDTPYDILLEAKKDFPNIYDEIEQFFQKARARRARYLMGMEVRLQKAAVEGDLAWLNEILEEDSKVLREFKVGCLAHTPLHVAASRGHSDFVERILKENKALGGVLDLRKWSPLHLACDQGHDKVVQVLVLNNPEMCFSQDGDGRNPLHLAAIKNHYKVLKVIFDAKPFPDHELLNAKDARGNTILHLAVKHRAYQTVRYLLLVAAEGVKNEDTVKAVNALNANENTAYDILLKIRKVMPNLDELKKSFRNARALRAKDLTQDTWLSQKRESLMVVASLIATMAFQAGVSPPGGVWQDNSKTHRVGEAVMAYNYPDSFPYFLPINTLGFVASLSTILLLVTGWPFQRKIFMWLLVLTMWATITSIAFTYAYSIVVITPKKHRIPLTRTIVFGAIVWGAVIVLLFITHSVHWINGKLKSKFDIHVGIWIKRVSGWEKIKKALGFSTDDKCSLPAPTKQNTNSVTDGTNESTV